MSLLESNGPNFHIPLDKLCFWIIILLFKQLFIFSLTQLLRIESDEFMQTITTVQYYQSVFFNFTEVYLIYRNHTYLFNVYICMKWTYIYTGDMITTIKKMNISIAPKMFPVLCFILFVCMFLIGVMFNMGSTLLNF